MANISTHPNISQTGNADLSLTESVTTFPVMPTDSNGALQTRADQALWDPTSSAYVSIVNTNAGTTACLKVGQ